MGKSWAERHPILTGALVGSIVPGIGTLAGALGGVIYDVVERNSGTEDAKKREDNEKRGE
jgi:hypothetical protein